jgi:Zn2+/Cd2+-exporting ATPase
MNKKLLIDSFAALISFLLMVIASLITTNLNIWFWAGAFLIGGMSKAIEGVKKTIEERSLNVEFLMIAAASAAFFTGEYAEGAILIFIFAVSGVLESYATSQSEKALTKLLNLAPKQAVRVDQDGEHEILVSDLKQHDVVVVRPGQQIPADGVISQGGASINEASITGEFNPVSKMIGAPVFGGSIVIDSVIYITVSKDPRDSVVQKIIALVAQAQADKTKSEKRITTFEKFYVYGVIALSLTVMLVSPMLGWLDATEAFRRGVIVLVVASPCALVASVSPAILSTLSHAARKGILIKGGRYLEMLLKIKMIAFDKTGTMTTGKPKVIETYFASGIDQPMVLRVLVNMERNSTHPLAKAISEFYAQLDPETFSIKEIPGRGLQAQIGNDLWQIGKFEFTADPDFLGTYQATLRHGYTVVMVIRNGQFIAFVSLSDTIRPQAKRAIEELNKLGIQSLMLTGDSNETAAAIAHSVGISNFQGNCLPEDKLSIIQQHQANGVPVLMVGDGINDSPSLAAASLGVSMGDGTDVSLETADIIVMNNNLAHVPYLIRLSRKMKTITMQNIVFSLSVIAVLLFSNLFGLIQLRSGVISHEVSTILVVLNSLRLLKIR